MWVITIQSFLTSEKYLDHTGLIRLPPPKSYIVISQPLYSRYSGAKPTVGVVSSTGSTK